MNTYAKFLLLASCLSVFSLGCSGEDEWVKKLPKTVEASGVVTLDGEPVEGASVVAAPMEGGQHAANALTDSDGYFELKAFPAKEGAVPGQYKIMVTKTVALNADGSIREPVDSTDPEMTPSGDHAASAGGGWKNVLPQQYANPNSSGLTINIPEGGKTDITLELKS